MSNIGGSDIRLGVNPAGVASGLAKARQDFELFTRKVNGDLSAMYKTANDNQRVFRAGIVRLGSDLKDLGQKASLVVSLPALYSQYKAYQDYANIQRMEKGLTLYGETLSDVRRLAKEPNIGIFDSAKSLIGLRAVRIESSLAERAVKSFANAITASGGNAADLEPALFNLKQFKGTQNINQVDLRQLANRIPQTMEVLEKAFGTTDTEKLNKLGIDKFIEGFITELEKLPKVEELAASASEQLGDSFTFFSGKMGEAIDKAFGVTSVLKGLSGMLDSAADGFATLNPSLQKAILILGGLAVVIPPIIAAVGGLVALWPALAAGWPAFVASMSAAALPVGIALAVAAAVGGLIYLLTSASEETRNLADQQKYLAESGSKLDPLLQQYDELKAKTSLTEKEQEQLKKVTNEIAQIAPSAATGWDRYGKAVDISTDKVKVHTQEQRKLLKALQDTRRETLLAENKSADARIKEIDSLLNPGSPTKLVNIGMGQYQTQSTRLADSEVLKYAAEQQKLQEQKAKNRSELGTVANVAAERREIRELEQRRKEVKAKSDSAKKDGAGWSEIDVLRVEGLKIKAQIDEKRKVLDTVMTELSIGGNATLPETKVNKKTKDEADATGDLIQKKKILLAIEEQIASIDKSMKYEKLRKELKATEREYKEFFGVAAGLDVQRLSPIGSTLNPSIYSTRERGKAATSRVMENRLPGSINANSEAIAKATQFEGARLAASLDVKSILGDSSSLNSIREFFQKIPELAGESAEGYKSRLYGFVEATNQLDQLLSGDATLDNVKKFYEQLPKLAEEGLGEYQERISKTIGTTQQLRESLNSELEQMGEGAAYGFGELLGNLTNGTNGVQKFGQSLLGGLANMAKGMGKALIAAGIGGSAFKKIMTVPALAIPAGIALVGIGTALANSMKSSMNTASMTRLAKGGLAYREMSAIIGDNPNARFDPEMVAPYSKIDGSINDSVKRAQQKHGMGQTIIPDIQVRGADLWIIMKRQEAANKALGIG